MTKIVDLRGDSRIMGPTNPNRLVAGITKIARHHSAAATGDVWAFQNHWRGTLGWGTGGYHEIILRDGSVQLIYRDNVTTNGVGNHNSKTYHICVVGNGSFTAEQEKAFDERARAAMQRFNLKASDVLGHNEFSGHASNSCPGTNMAAVRSRLGASGGSTVTKPTPQPTPSPAPTPTPAQPAQLVVDGSLGPLTAKRWQEVTKMQIQDGRISHQWRQAQNQNIHAAIFDTTLKGSNLIRDTQRRLGIKQDGLCGTQTITAMQRAKGSTADGFISAPQSQLVMAIQRDLNAGRSPF
ncbi:MAG TPA: hypothetical protein DIT57_01740 [Enterococcus sp.]|nr:hypothetical protein [Enterococcus sp.]